MMYLKELSTTHDGGQYFRYESWEDYYDTSFYTVDAMTTEPEKTLAEELGWVFDQVIEQTTAEDYPESIEDPEFVTYLDLEWENHDGEHSRHWILGEKWIDTDWENTKIAPADAMGSLIKSLSATDPSLPGMDDITRQTTLTIVNQVTGNIAIFCQNPERCGKLVVEIDTTELNPVKNILASLGLLPPNSKKVA